MAAAEHDLERLVADAFRRASWRVHHPRQGAKLFWKHVEVVEILTEIPVEKDFKDYFVKSSGQIVCSD